MKRRKITVVGGGNVGTLISSEFCYKGHQVTIYTHDETKWNDTITVYNKDDDTQYTVKPYLITSDIKESISSAELIFITLPSLAIKEFIEEAEEYIRPGSWICFYPGTGGVEFLCNKLLAKGCVIFGTQRICSVARLNEYGRSVTTAGKRKQIFLGAIPKIYTEEARKLFAELFDIETIALPNYLNVTLTPSNPILHPSRLYNIYKNYHEGVTYEKIPLFYEQWNDSTSKTLIKLDNELHKLLNKIKLDTSYIRPLLEHYESNDYKSLTKKITSIESLKGLTTPSILTSKGYIPDLNSRYFAADFPHGLVIIKAFAMILNEPTEGIDTVINWYQKIVNKEYINIKENKLGVDSKELHLPQLYGIDTIDKLEAFYIER